MRANEKFEGRKLANIVKFSPSQVFFEMISMSEFLFVCISAIFDHFVKTFKKTSMVNDVQENLNGEWWRHEIEEYQKIRFHCVLNPDVHFDIKLWLYCQNVLFFTTPPQLT